MGTVLALAGVPAASAVFAVPGLAAVAAMAAFGEPDGQGWTQIAELGIALVLSGLIGFEREIRGKAAGLRTHTIIGFGAALIVLVSKYGFTDVLGAHATLDPSRVAAQIVSGIGFIGGGLIFVRRDAVRGLTTAASVWLTTGIGMAAGAGLPVLAVASTAGYFVIIYGMSALVRRLPGSTHRVQEVRVTYVDGRGLLRTILERCTGQGFVVNQVSTHPMGGEGRQRDEGMDRPGEAAGDRLVNVVLGLTGAQDVGRLLSGLADLDGVVHAGVNDEDE
ncbi:MgtC/SapB family protein [Segeticoccus rhizosphaerae]|jgi:putative Mg2+ transporter-C (MgtC) family protein|uniref:MgtC/SapB family protein n=1 Tax=Segeticoccus rhizosphaerae TaxID=1104777 RepID=UPI001EEFBA11|nr:MgtC/SapB family protein [Segeticoccus rhizosphaerae]